MSKVEITVGVAGTGSFLLDGHDIGGGVVGFDMDTRIGHTPRIRVDLGITATYITGEFDVMMSDYTAGILQRAGWTPPKRPVVIAFDEPVPAVA